MSPLQANKTKLGKILDEAGFANPEPAHSKGL